MKISRNITLKILFLLDELTPPLLRDSRLFMWLPFKLVFGNKAELMMSFKERAPLLSSDEISSIYEETADVHISRETDINSECLSEVRKKVIGEKVLDIACGRGYLSSLLSHDHDVHGVDFVISKSLYTKYPDVKFIEANIEDLPFGDNYFDTVICAHTLEHVMNPAIAVSEIRRVAAQRVIVILPKQRPSRYTFDLHVNFYPYYYDVLRLMSPGSKHYECYDCGGDWFYVEYV